MKKIGGQWKNWKFNKKIQFLVTASVLAITLIAMAVTTFFSVRSLRQQYMRLNYDRISTISGNLANALEEDKALLLSLVLSEEVQEFGKASKDDDSLVLSKQCSSLFSSMLNMYPNVNFIVALNSDWSKYVFRGGKSLKTTMLTSIIEQDYRDARRLGRSSVRISYNQAYDWEEQNTLNMYFPIYDTQTLNEEHGLLCLNITDPSLRLIHEETEGYSDLCVITGDGIVFSDGGEEAIGAQVKYAGRLKEDTGTIKDGMTSRMYRKIDGWDLYVVGAISVWMSYQSSIMVIVTMIVLVGSLLLVLLKITRSIIQKSYRPLDDLVSSMDEASKGYLEVRLDEDVMGEDFARLAVGFNSMMAQIQTLMVRIQQEQKEMDQIRFNALQSQIHPHFLYNTLECIHWQAMTDGNREISKMVKALARYYRICLSDGHDVIPLHLELEHVKNYLIIQNMRFDNLIDSEISCAPEADDAMIPKLTLQPLVENAIQHGIRLKADQHGKLRIRARVEKDVFISVSDDGIGMTPEEIENMNKNIRMKEVEFGYGVRNVNRRIGLLYGEAFGLRYESNSEGGVTVNIRIPLRRGDSDIRMQQ